MKTASLICSKSRPKKKTDTLKLILCDLGNVLINFDHRIAVRRILPYTEKKYGEILQLFFDSPVTKDFEEGRISGPRFFKEVKKSLALKELSYARFVRIYSEIFSENRGILEVLEDLKKTYRLYLVSNINELHYGYIAKMFPEHLAVFDRVYLSCSVGARKPNPLIYRRAVREAGVRAEEVLYADDRRDLVKAARKLGIRSVVFKGVAYFKKQLKRLGVSV